MSAHTMTREWADGREQLKRPLMLSAVAHICLAIGAIAATFIHGNPAIWGAGGGEGMAASVRLVSAASVPLPQPTIPTENRVATENKGLHQPEPPKPPEPKPAVKPPEEKAVDLPSRDAKVTPPKEAPKRVEEPEPPKPEPRREIARAGSGAQPALRDNRFRPRPEEPTNEIPYGQGGPATGPFGMITTDSGSGGVRVTGGAGDFLSRYSWYVIAIRNRISSNWLKATVDPRIATAPRVYVTFQILRDGRVVNPQLTASSGISSLDRSAVRAVYDSSPMPPLPGDYPGPSVAVEFWFDFRR
jgi:protein TonB